METPPKSPQGRSRDTRASAVDTRGLLPAAQAAALSSSLMSPAPDLSVTVLVQIRDASPNRPDAASGASIPAMVSLEGSWADRRFLP